MLIKCPECALQVSDIAAACPHCGFPIKKMPKSKQTRAKKRMKLPNGFGQIYEIKNRNLRKPFRALVTVGKTPDGKIITKPLKPEAYFETYNDAYAALVEYNKNPYDLEPDITVSQLYTRWSEDYFKQLKSDSSKRSIRSAWSYCGLVYKMRAKDVRARHIKACMEDGVTTVKGELRHTTPNLKGRIKSMFNLMYDYAEEYEIVDKNYARTFDLPSEIADQVEEERTPHKSFGPKEIKALWENIGIVPYADVVLFQCYSGWRPQELGLLEISDVNFDEWTITGGMKTPAGKGRVVPIHTAVRDIVKARYEEAVKLKSKYLFNAADTATHRGSYMLTYEKYRSRFFNVRDALNLDPGHRPHDPRMFFVTISKRCHVDEYALKRMVGHSIRDITEKIYTEREVSWLCEEIEKIKVPE